MYEKYHGVSFFILNRFHRNSPPNSILTNLLTNSSFFVCVSGCAWGLLASVSFWVLPFSDCVDSWGPIVLRSCTCSYLDRKEASCGFWSIICYKVLGEFVRFIHKLLWRVCITFDKLSFLTFWTVIRRNYTIKFPTKVNSRNDAKLHENAKNGFPE